MKYFFLVAAASLVSVSDFAQGKKLEPKDVPAPVMNKFSAFYSEVKKAKWEKEGDNYEATFKGSDKKKMSVTYSPEGNTLEKEWEIKKTEMPKPVQDSLAKKFPGAKCEEFSKIDRNGLIVYEVEMEMKDKDKKETELKVLFTPEGKIWSREEEKEEDKKKDEKKK
jgi:hypothetical protein